MLSEREIIQTARRLFGRTEITTPYRQIDEDNLLEVLGKALAIHNVNSSEIDYLYKYARGNQPVLNRINKGSRPEICNKIVENHALEIALFTSGYFLGEPVTYVRRGDGRNTSSSVQKLNDYMFYEDKSSCDKEMSTWMAICGVGYRMVLPKSDFEIGSEDSPFEIDTPDPRKTFCVYNSGFGHKCVLAAQQVTVVEDGQEKQIICGYTKDRYFETDGNVIRRWEKHIFGGIPIVEYRLNMLRMGSFEAAISLLDGLNTLASNRIDGVEEFVQSFFKFINCDIDEEKYEQFKKKGAIAIKSVNGLNGDVQLITGELNQTQVQTLNDYIYDQVLTICALPTTKKGGTSTSDTGAAVILRDGWEQCEARAKDTELLFKRSEKEFLKIVLKIMSDMQQGIELSVSQVECKFTRRQHDALLTKTQSLQNMLSAGVAPEVSFATCGLFNDPTDVVAQSRKYLRKYEVSEETGETETTGTEVNSSTENTSETV